MQPGVRRQGGRQVGSRRGQGGRQAGIDKGAGMGDPICLIPAALTVGLCCRADKPFVTVGYDMPNHAQAQQVRRRGGRLTWSVTWMATLMLLAASATTQAGVARTETHDYWHLQKGQREYKNVGLMNIFGTEGAGICSGVLISPRIMLTAGHCVLSPGLGSLTGANIEIGGKNYTAQKWAIHPQWNGTNLTKGVDLALVKLDRPVTNVKAAKLARGGNEQGKKASTAGFGAGGNGTFGYFTPAGTKRVGENIIDFIEGPKKRVLLYDFDGPNQIIVNPKNDYPLALEYMAAPGDSGGGLFVGDTLVGVTSFIIALEDGIADATFRDYAGFTRVQKWHKWIQKTQRDLMRNRPGKFGDPNNPLPTGNIAAGMQQTWKGAPVAPLLWMDGVSSVPEPTTAVLLGLGSLLLARRRRHAR